MATIGRITGWSHWFVAILAVNYHLLFVWPHLQPKCRFQWLISPNNSVSDQMFWHLLFQRIDWRIAWIVETFEKWIIGLILRLSRESRDWRDWDLNGGTASEPNRSHLLIGSDNSGDSRVFWVNKTIIHLNSMNLNITHILWTSLGSTDSNRYDN